MSLSQRERTEFVSSYTRALISAWSSQEYEARLAEDPRAALAEAGIDLPPGAEVEIVRAVRDSGDVDGGVDIQVDLYQTGLQTGHFEIRIPYVPQVDTAELSDSDLEGVAAGEVLCCCCPCCCCT